MHAINVVYVSSSAWQLVVNFSLKREFETVIFRATRGLHACAVR